VGQGNNNYRSSCRAGRKYADAERIVHKSRAFNRRLKATLLRKRRTEGTHSIHLWSDPMSIATYRGVRYDTDARKSAPTEKHVVAETYRGTKHTEVVEMRK
jgi:hypothetical protein